MPLVRYEIRNEHSLANPQLYRTASNDDPEGLLEGVAMAGLVGIVRQLGDLAEFAAEVFRDLHEEVMATASRGHELLARVQQLEAEIPAVEKALLSETNQLRFAYTPGVEWHANIRNDQNHCTQGDLPRFIRNSYEECRGPPRLFLLDKFDVAGAGACLKRYTDPSFFRTEWANSELMKAERVHRDKRAKREKKKGRRRRNGDLKESIPVDQLHTRYSHELSKELTQPDAHPRIWHQPVVERSEEASLAPDNMNYTNPNLGPKGRQSPEAPHPVQDTTKIRIVPDSNSLVAGLPAFSEDSASVQSEVLGASVKDLKEEHMAARLRGSDGQVDVEDNVCLQSQEQVTAVDDGGSEGDQFVDALATIESEVDSDSEPRPAQDALADVDIITYFKEGELPLHEDLRVSGALELPTDGNISPPGQDSPKSVVSDLLGHSQYNSNMMNGKDAEDASPVATIIHKKRLSSESIMKAENRHPLDVPSESYVTCDEPVTTSRKYKTFEQSATPSLGAGAKVSKMVAAIEKGSMEQMQDDGTQDITLGAIAESDHMLQDCNSPYAPGPERRAALTKATSPHLHESPSLPRIRVDALSSHESPESLDSPPDSPLFSALHSPMSPIRTSRNVLSSPDSQRLGFVSELLGPGSPTSVPVLEHSPTSQTRPPSISPFQWEDDEGINLVKVEKTLIVTSSLPSSQFDEMLVVNPLPQQASDSETPAPASQSAAAVKTLHADDAPLLTIPQNSNDHCCLPSARNLDNLSTSTVPDGFVSPVPQVSDNCEELTETLITVEHEVYNFNPIVSPRTPNMEYSSSSILVSPKSPNDITNDSPHPYTNSDHASYQDSVKGPLEPVFTPTSAPLSSPFTSPSVHEFTPRLSLKDGHGQFIHPTPLDLRTDESPSPSDSSELSPLPTHVVLDNSFPPGITEDFELSPSSTPLQDLPEPATVPSKAVPETLVPAPKSTRDHWSALPPSRTLHNLPPPTPPSKSQRDFRPPPPPPSQAPPPLPGLHELSTPPHSASKQVVGDVQDALLDAITSHDKSMLKKVKTMQNPTLRKGENRSHLLEQIRAQSFNLRHTVVEKADPPPPRPMTNINVAAILEKANAIRQAFAGSDEDDDENDDWSDM